MYHGKAMDWRVKDDELTRRETEKEDIHHEHECQH